MIRNYRDLTRWEMEQIDKEETIVLIPLGALEQPGPAGDGRYHSRGYDEGDTKSPGGRRGR